jgi:hypothetical protein
MGSLALAVAFVATLATGVRVPSGVTYSSIVAVGCTCAAAAFGSSDAEDAVASGRGATASAVAYEWIRAASAATKTTVSAARKSGRNENLRTGCRSILLPEPRQRLSQFPPQR